jgi:hypothetical protein
MPEKLNKLTTDPAVAYENVTLQFFNTLKMEILALVKRQNRTILNNFFLLLNIIIILIFFT